MTKQHLSTRSDSSVAFGSIITLVLGAAVIYQEYRIRKLQQKEKERTKPKKEKKANSSNIDTVSKSQDLLLVIKPIGYISTLYQLCIGTPRQGLLAPNSRGIIYFDKSRLNSTCLKSLEEFSHLWLIFEFHANTNTKSVTNSLKQNSTTQFPSFVKPPALKGQKVGLFASRTPHRPNPIGLSLCRLVKIDFKTFCIHVEGVDLIHQTPILDIKPFVPHYDSASDVRLPSWVTTGLSKRKNVIFEQESMNQLQNCLVSLKFFKENELNKVKACIEDILSVDIRSVYQTKQQKQNNFKAHEILKVDSNAIQQDEKLCSQQIDNMLVSFKATDTEIIVKYIELIQIQKQ